MPKSEYWQVQLGRTCRALTGAGSRSTCSVASSWYSMDKALASKPGGMEPDDFNSLLVHAMILHGIGESAELLKQVEGADGR